MEDLGPTKIKIITTGGRRPTKYWRNEEITIKTGFVGKMDKIRKTRDFCKIDIFNWKNTVAKH